MKPKDIEALLSSLEEFQSAARPVTEFDSQIMISISELYTDLLVALDIDR